MLIGGGAMCFAKGARNATRDIGFAYMDAELGIDPEYDTLLRVAKEVYGAEYPLLFGNVIQQDRVRRFISML